MMSFICLIGVRELCKGLLGGTLWCWALGKPLLLTGCAAHATGHLDGNNDEMRPSFWCPFSLLVVMDPIQDSEFTLGLGDISITLRKG